MVKNPQASKSITDNSSFIEAQFEEGWDYLMGDNFRIINRDRGKELIEKSMREGCSVARGFCHFRGWGNLEKDFGEAYKLFSETAESEGDVSAANRSTALALKGYLCRKGCGPNPNVKDAVLLLTEAAENQHAWAMAMLAFWFQEDEELCSNDNEAAFQMYKNSAELGYSKSMYNLAELYYTGVGVSKNSSEGNCWLQKAADLGYAPAREKLDAEKSGKSRRKVLPSLTRRSSERSGDESFRKDNKKKSDIKSERKNVTKEKKSRGLFRKMTKNGSGRSITSKSIFSSFSRSRVGSSKASASYGVITDRKENEGSTGNSVVSDITDN